MKKLIWFKSFPVLYWWEWDITAIHPLPIVFFLKNNHRYCNLLEGYILIKGLLWGEQAKKKISIFTFLGAKISYHTSLLFILARKLLTLRCYFQYMSQDQVKRSMMMKLVWFKSFPAQCVLIECVKDDSHCIITFCI